MATTDTLVLPPATVPDTDMELDSGPTPPPSTAMPALDTAMVPATAMASAPLMLMPRLTMATTDTLVLPPATVPDTDMELDSGPTPPPSMATPPPLTAPATVPATVMASAPLMPRLSMATTVTLVSLLATVPDTDMVLDSGPTPPPSTAMPAPDTATATKLLELFSCRPCVS